MSQQAAERTYFTVSALVARLVQMLDRELGIVWVRGEVGGLTVARSGHAYFQIKDPQELVTLQTNLLKAVPEKATSYLRHVQAIATSSGAEVRQYAEDLGADAKTGFANLVETATQNAPAGTENAVALVKSTVAAATKPIESAQQVAKEATDKAVEAVEAHLDAKA